MSAPWKRLGEIAANLQAEGCSLEAQINGDDAALLAGALGPGVAIQDGKLVFSSLEERNKRAVAYHLDALGGSASAEDVFSLARDLYRREHRADDKLSGRLVAAYAQGADLLLLGAQVISGKASANVFDVLHTLEAAFPYCERLTANGLIALCRSQFEATRRDLMSGRIFNVIQQRLQSDPATCEAILDTLRLQMSEDAGPMYGCATRAWAATSPDLVVPRLLQDGCSANAALAANAVWVLGVLAGEGILPSAFESATWQMLDNQSGAADPGIRRAAIMAIEKTLGVWPDAGNKLLELASDADETALLAVSQALLFRANLMKDLSLFKKFVDSLIKTQGRLSGIVENIDFVLDELIKGGQFDVAVEFMERWVVETLDPTEADEICNKLHSACHSIFNEKAPFQRLLTRWLASPNPVLNRAAADMVTTLGIHKVNDLSLGLGAVLAMDKPSLLHMTRKIIGYVTNEKSLVSLAGSMITEELVQKHGSDILKELFVDEIGMDYPGEVISHLSGVKCASCSQDVIVFCDLVISKIEEYFAAIEKLPRLGDLRPPASWERAFMKEQGKLMEVHRKKAEEKSVLRSLMTVIPLKAGGASFSRFDGVYREPTKLGSFSASYTLPRRHALDAVGYEIHQLSLRVAEFGE